MWATPDAEFAHAQCKIYNDWAWETFAKYNDRMSPIAAIATADLPGSIKEIERVAKLGFRGLTLPCKPIFGAHDARHPNYNLPIFDPMWAVIQEADLPITFHVSTGRDPRAARKDGGAVINYVSHSLVPTIEPVANLCGSGVLERFPGIKFAAIESGIGWVAWALEAMDEAYHKHHMWALPRLKMLPSEYFRKHGYASFQEDPVGLDLAVKYNLTNNFLWANDYPHHEGSWPHSAEAIEREMGGLPEDARAKILGLNAARLFKFDVDALTRSRRDRVAAATRTERRSMPAEFSHHYAQPRRRADPLRHDGAGCSGRVAPRMAADLVRMAARDAAARGQVRAGRARYARPRRFVAPHFRLRQEDRSERHLDADAQPFRSHALRRRRS